MIWKQSPDLDRLNAINKDTLGAHIGIEFISYTENSLTARMPVDERTRQPMGLLHGGASAVLAETLGSVASVLCCTDPIAQAPVGLDISSQHLRAVRSGYVTATAEPIRIGRTLHHWHIRQYDDEQRLCCDSRLKVMVRSA